MKPRVAVIDAGSNSIKALVASSDGGPYGLRALYEKTLEVRISHGIGGEPPMLRADRIEAGVEAVADLWEDCQQHGPLEDIKIVATSAVRSAANGHLFMEAVAAMTGCTPTTLTGAEEADGIANGVRTDAAIENHLNDFTVFDLGGGSLELIRFEHHGVTDRTSLPLGSVRLTEHFFKDASRPIPKSEQEQLSAFVESHILATGFPTRSPLVGCSGGLAALRGVFANNAGTTLANGSPLIPRSFIDTLTAKVVSQDLTARIKDSGLPPRRADIFPAALLTFQVLLNLSKADEILHSLHNLRYGIAWSLLHRK